MEDKRQIHSTDASGSPQGSHGDSSKGASGQYSPLQTNGNGLQGIYLTELSVEFAQVLFGLIGPAVDIVISTAVPATGYQLIAPVDDEIEGWERRIENTVATDKSIPRQNGRLW